MNYLKTTLKLSYFLTRRFFRDGVALFFTFLFPLIFLLVFGGIFSGNQAPSFTAGVINQSDTEFSKEFLANLSDSGLFNFDEFSDINEAEESLGRGEIDVVLRFDENFGQPNETGQPSGELNVLYDEADNQLLLAASAVLDNFIDEINQQSVQTEKPFTLTTQSLQTTNLSQFDYTFAGLIGFSILSLGIFGMSNAFPADKKSGSLRRIQSTPLRSSQLVLATALQYLLLSFITMTLMIVVSVVLFDFSMRGNFALFYLYGTIGTIMLFGFGLAIGGWAKNENQASPIANLLSFPMMFLSGVFFPVFIMPETLQKISRFVPLTPVIDGLRFIATENKGLFDLGFELAVISVWTVVIYLTAFKLFRWE